MTFADRLAAILAKAGIPAREVRVYGSQAHFDVSQANKVRAVSLMAKAGFRFRGECDNPLTMMSKPRVGTTLYFVLEG